jgi:trehalose 6-phosphate phosphatase
MPVTRHPADTPAQPTANPTSPALSGDLATLADLPVPGTRHALFLDFDGTLVDLASQPEAIAVPPDLPEILAELSLRVGGALAIVSGRKLTDLDRFLNPLRLPVAAEHGAQRRLHTGETMMLATPDLREVIRAAYQFAERHPGLQIEVKSAAVALHYRHAPELQARCLEFMCNAAESTPGVELLHGKCVFEIKPSGISKGTAINDFMKWRPFKGRLPIFAGDDVTDEAGFSVVQALGGVAIKVGSGPTLASHRCPSPAELLAWLSGDLTNSLPSRAPTDTAPRPPASSQPHKKNE